MTVTEVTEILVVVTKTVAWLVMTWRLNPTDGYHALDRADQVILI